MTNQHTQGPWSSRGTLGPRHMPHLKGPCVVEVEATGCQLAALTGWRTETQIADARLMAAAPEMLECLREITELLAHYWWDDPMNAWMYKAQVLLEKIDSDSGGWNEDRARS